MFNCEICRRTTASGEPQVKLVIKKRAKTYQNKEKTTTGWEIVEEVKVCHGCAKAIQLMRDQNGVLTDGLMSTVVRAGGLISAIAITQTNQGATT